MQREQLIVDRLYSLDNSESYFAHVLPERFTARFAGFIPESGYGAFVIVSELLGEEYRQAWLEYARNRKFTFTLDTGEVVGGDIQLVGYGYTRMLKRLKCDPYVFVNEIEKSEQKNESFY